MSFILGDNENIFIDLNVYMNADKFVLDQVYRYLYRMNDPKDPFHRLREVIDSVGYEKMSEVAQLKSFKNPLIEFASEMDYDIEEFCDAVYDNVLFNVGSSAEYVSRLQFTSIGNALNILLKDNSFENFYVYIGPVRHDNIIEHILNTSKDKTKLNIIVGDKEGFLKDHECDNYFFDSVTSMRYIQDERKTKMRSVYVPAYKYNMMEDGITARSTVPIPELKKKYKIILNTINLPFL